MSKMTFDQGSEFVSVMIPRTVDTRFMFLNSKGRGLWLPTSPRVDDESLKNLATKFAEEASNVLILFAEVYTVNTMHLKTAK